MKLCEYSSSESFWPCPCNIQRFFFSTVKIEIFIGNKMIIFHKTLVDETVLTSTHNLCFKVMLRKCISMKIPVVLYESGD